MTKSQLKTSAFFCLKGKIIFKVREKIRKGKGEKNGEGNFLSTPCLIFCGRVARKTKNITIFAAIYTYDVEMKDFLKFTLASFTGILLAGGVLLILGIIALVGIIAASSEPSVQVNPQSVFVLKLNKPIEERAIEDPLTLIMGEEYASMGLNDVLTSIQRAKEHDNICGIYIEAGYYIDYPIAILEEMRRALLDFKESGKFVVAYGDNYTQDEYYLCSVADKVMLNPQGVIDWVGLSENPVFLKRLLEKIGVEVEIFKVGTYKSAVEPFINTKMSDASREQTNAYLLSIWQHMVEDVATSRGLSITQLNEYADQMLSMSPSEDFIQAGLADTLTYKADVVTYLKRLTHNDINKDIRSLSMKEMIRIEQVTLPHPKNTIAVYYAGGEIVDNATPISLGTTEGIDGNKMCKDLSQLREDDNVKAVVLRVNSPGGSAFASEQIWHEVVKLKAIKPVIVSMGSAAASGGYYISCAADSIFAEASTLTGSIGIYGMIPNMKDLVTEKIGLDFDVVKTNSHSDMNFPIRALSESEKTFIQKNVERGYALFVKRCAEGRGMSEEAIRKVAEGRVWTGAMAKEIGLVDELGGINEAIKAASEKAQLEEFAISYYPEKQDPLSQLLQSGKEDYINSQLRGKAGHYYDYLNIVHRLQHLNPMQAHMGFYPNI